MGLLLSPYTLPLSLSVSAVDSAFSRHSSPQLHYVVDLISAFNLIFFFEKSFRLQIDSSMASNLENSEEESLEEKLRSLLGQLRTECGILERMVYKNKNQHRRCSYFQYLLKVRRDLRLLQSANLGEILSSCFQVITGKRPKQKVHLLESLKKRKLEVGRYNFMERLLGVARLLSQMVEPMLKAATEISVLLAQSFFMGFSLTILALLARIRVLVQQILLDVVSVYNMVSSLAQSKQSVKITEGGLEVFREVFPTKEEYIVLECVWKSDKFVLVERTQNSDIASHGLDLEGQTPLKASSSVQYLSIESFLGDDETPSDVAKEDQTAEKGPTRIKEDTAMTNLHTSPAIGDNNKKDIEGCPEGGEASSIEETPSQKLPQSSLFPCSSSSLSTSKRMSTSRKVAFLAVKSPVPSTSNVAGIHVKETESKSGSKEDSFFSLLAAGSTKENLI